MKSILIVGPMPEPTTGVSLANKIVYDNLLVKENFSIDYVNTSYNKFEEKLGSFTFSKAVFYFKSNLYAYKTFKASIVYITPGQTFYGLAKYLIFIILAKVLNKELIIHVHGNYINKEYSLLKGLKKKLFKKLLSYTSKGIVLSKSLVNNMSPFISNDRIYILNNFVQNYLFPTEREIENKLKVTKPRILFLSNLMKEKGILDLLEALRILESQGFEYEAKIAGNIDDNNKANLESYFKTLKNTEYCGVVSGNNKKELFLWGNIFVLPTYYAMEGQPISILEAMATGNVILTTNHAGIPDVFIEDENGYYVDKNSPPSIANRITMLSIENRNRICRSNVEYATKKFKEENFINNITKIFDVKN